MAHDISKKSLESVQSGLTELATALNVLANRSTPMPDIANGSISGDKIRGGTILDFQSSGIKDTSRRLVVLVNDQGLVTDSIDTDVLVGDTKITGDLTVTGSVTAQKMHVVEFSSEIHNERSTSLEYKFSEESPIVDKGIIWSGKGAAKTLVLKEGPDRLYSSENIELHREAAFMIDSANVLTKIALGPSVRTSSLQRVGVLQNLKTTGDVVLGDSVFWNNDFNRLGIMTDQPNGTLSIGGVASEFIIDEEDDGFKLGTWTSNNFSIVTDDTVRLTVFKDGNITFGQKGSNDTKVSVFGKMGIGVNNVDPDVSLDVKGPIKVQGQKQEVGEHYPTTGNYTKGDIVWNSNPVPGGFVGWICTIAGSPGQWKQFGAISR